MLRSVDTHVENKSHVSVIVAITTQTVSFWRGGLHCTTEKYVFECNSRHCSGTSPCSKLDNRAAAWRLVTFVCDSAWIQHKLPLLWSRFLDFSALIKVTRDTSLHSLYLRYVCK